MFHKLTTIFKEYQQYFGTAKAVEGLALLACKRTMNLTVLKCVKLPDVSEESLKTNPRYQCRFLEESELLRFAEDPSLELNPAFIRSATVKGDRCYGILDGEVLASYGWYSTGVTEVFPGRSVSFNPNHVYMYKGFTHPQYRGQRLHAVGMGRALRAYRSQGSQGILSFVEAQNFSSLKSCYRLGYEDIGAVFFFEGMKRSFRSPGCYEYDMELLWTGTEGAGEPSLAVR